MILINFLLKYLILPFQFNCKLCLFIFIASKRLSDLIRRPYDLYRAGVFDEYFMGLMNQVAQAMDDSITQEVKQWSYINKIGSCAVLHDLSFVGDESSLQKSGSKIRNGFGIL